MLVEVTVEVTHNHLRGTTLQLGGNASSWAQGDMVGQVGVEQGMEGQRDSVGGEQE